MAGNYEYPGVHLEEVSSEMRTITGVATSITAFIGRALRGPVNDPIHTQSFAEFSRLFGGLWCESSLGYAIQHYFLNGGRDALIVRVVDENSAAPATVSLSPDLTLEAVDPGRWGKNLQVTVDHDTVDKDEDTPTLFNLTVKEIVEGETCSVETFGNLSVQNLHPRDVVSLLEQQSSLVRVREPRPSARPESTKDEDGSPVPESFRDNGSDGGPVGFKQIGDESRLAKEYRGIWSLDKAVLFNLLCIPPFGRAGDRADVDRSTWDAAVKYCRGRRAMLIVDPPGSWSNPRDVLNEDSGVDGDEQSATVPARDANAAIYFPRIRVADPLQDNRLDTFAPCGAVAGVYARTDAEHGVWKAPAGRDATLFGVRGLACVIRDDQNGQLNELGVNCLRSFPAIGNVVWGARTLRGADSLADEWKYVPVRRLALFLEESLYRGTRWAVFEPNDEPLWAQIRAHADSFMHDLFRQGALEGRTPREAYFVKCDSETTTQADIDRGIVNLLIGFAPLKPAEFIIITISQIAGNNGA